tara:strand:+ start:387 stop:1244 length:858 start_codon:yes stop_codon:yes gene_type:complete
MSFLLNPVFLLVLLGVALVTTSASAIGCFLYVQRNALIGETLAHGCLPGIYCAFLIGGTRNLLWLTLGATLSGLLSSLLVDLIVTKTRLNRDAAMAIVLSSMFGFGVVLLSFIQQAGLPNQNGLEDLFFGNAAAMSKNDVMTIGVLSSLIWMTLFANFRKIQLVLFDSEFSEIQGVRPVVLRALISTLAAVSVAIGIQTAGAILMAALLIAPAASARLWTNRLAPMIVLAIIFGLIGGTLGTLCSYLAPKMPTGPWVVVCMTALFCFSVLGRRVSIWASRFRQSL